MSHIMKVMHAKGSGNERAHRVRGHGHGDFSHPTRFEALEQRMALSVAPVTPSIGLPAQDVIASGASGVNGSTGAVAGSNPANFSPASTTGSIAAAEGNTLDNQQVAFNTPYWLPNDRVVFQSPPSDQLPANVNQQANTPQGIRNFNIGPDTSTHFSSPGVTLTVRLPIIEDTGRHWVAQSALDDQPASDVSLDRRAELVGPTQLDHDVDSLPIFESMQDRSGGATHRNSVHLEPSAVDRMMANQSEADAVRTDAAIVEVAGDNGADTEPGAGPLAQALAASLASVTTVPVREHVWNKTDNWRKGRMRRAVR